MAEKEKSPSLAGIISDVYDHIYENIDFIPAILLYIRTLGSYLSELDETFDEIIEAANKRAGEEINKMPKERYLTLV